MQKPSGDELSVHCQASALEYCNTDMCCNDPVVNVPPLPGCVPKLSPGGTVIWVIPSASIVKHCIY